MREKHLFSHEFKLKEFGYGEWLEEPDAIEFFYKETRCAILRSPCGNLNGYINVDKAHPWFEKEFLEIDVEVHGGLSFSDFMEEEYWVGFDCGHSNDVCPAVEKVLKQREEEMDNPLKNLDNEFKEALERLRHRTYKNIAYVKSECEHLVDQMLLVKSIANIAQNP